MKKRSIKKGKLRLTACTAAALMLTVLPSCSLLPEEETFAAAPVVKVFEGASYVTSAIRVTDVELTEKVSVNYVPVQQENLSFTLTGRSYGEFLVSVGDSVEEGELLATLDMADLEDQMNGLKNQLSSLQLSVRQTQENRALAIRQTETMYAGSSELASRRNETAARYDEQIQGINDSIYITQLKINDLQEKISERQIRAPFAGSVTYVLATEPSEVSEKGKTVIKLADASMSLFRGSTENWNRTDPEAEYEVTVGGNAYTAHVKTEEELGIAVTAHEEGKKGHVYFVLDEPAYDLSDNASGRVVMTLAKKENVTAVQNAAVTTVNDRTGVYYQADSGIRKFKEVEIGLVGDYYTEVIKGAEEGEVVIVK